MAMVGLHGMTGEEQYKKEAVEMMERILDWTGPGASKLGRPQLAGEVGGSSLAVPMCVLSLPPRNFSFHSTHQHTHTHTQN